MKPTKHAEVMINGPRGQSFATVQVREDGAIDSWALEQAIAHAGNIYNEMPEPGETQQPDLSAGDL